MAQQYEEKYLEFRKILRTLEDGSNIRTEIPEYDRVVVGFLLWNIKEMLGKDLTSAQERDEFKRQLISCQIQLPEDQEEDLLSQLNGDTLLSNFAQSCGRCDAKDMGSFWILAAAMAGKTKGQNEFWTLVQSYGQYINEFAQYLTIRYIKGSFLLRATDYLQTVGRQLERYLKEK